MLIDNFLFAICFYGKIERGFRLRSSVLFTVFASLIWLTECIAQDATRMAKNDTLELIKKTRGAAKSTAFSGTALFESSGTARRMSNIDQGQVEGKVVRKVVSMAKKHVIDIYSDNVLRQYRPEEKVVIVSNVIRNGFPNLFSGDSAHILEHYSFVKGVDSTVSNIKVHSYEVVPKDKLRWKLKVWVERNTFLPVKVEYLDSQGTVIKREGFTSLVVSPRKVTVSDIVPESKKWRKFFISKDESGMENSFYNEPVKGFKLVSCFDSTFYKPQRNSGDTVDQNHCLFSDGVAHVSLVAFYEQKPNEGFRVGNWTKGCSSFKSGIVSNKTVLSFGCVPKETVQNFFSNSIR